MPIFCMHYHQGAKLVLIHWVVTDKAVIIPRSIFEYDSRKRVARTCTAFLPVSLAILVHT